MGDRGHNRHGAKEGGCAHYTGEQGSRLTQSCLGRGLLPYQTASSSIQPFGHSKPRSQTGKTGQWYDSTGRTVLQTVAQKPNKKKKHKYLNPRQSNWSKFENLRKSTLKTNSPTKTISTVVTEIYYRVDYHKRSVCRTEQNTVTAHD